MANTFEFKEYGYMVDVLSNSKCRFNGFNCSPVQTLGINAKPFTRQSKEIWGMYTNEEYKQELLVGARCAAVPLTAEGTMGVAGSSGKCSQQGTDELRVGTFLLCKETDQLRFLHAWELW